MKSMTFKNKVLFIFLSIISLGIYPFLLLKDKNESKKEELSNSNKIIVDIDKLKTLLGGNNNILGTEYTHTKTKIFIEDTKLVNIEEMNKMKGISGIVISSCAIKIIVGNSAQKIANKLLN